MYQLLRHILVNLEQVWRRASTIRTERSTRVASTLSNGRSTVQGVKNSRVQWRIWRVLSGQPISNSSNQYVHRCQDITSVTKQQPFRRLSP